MPSTPFALFDFKTAAARQFASRPTLRQVASQQIFSLLLEQLPWLAAVTPRLTNADPLMLDSPEAGTDYWTSLPLVDVVLQAMLEGRTLDLEAIEGRHHNLALAATHRFAGSSSEFDTRRLSGTTPAFNALLSRLLEAFCQAQVGYWNAHGDAGISRDGWLQALLKTALLRNLPLQDLDPQQLACVRGLLKGGDDQPAVYVVQTRLDVGEQQYCETQPGLLVSGEWDERQVVLWCSPSSEITAFDSFEGFALALRDVLARRVHFDGLTWERHALEGDVFARQSALLLDHMLDRARRVRYLDLASVAEMDALFAGLSDPSQWFLGGYYVEEASSVQLPPGILAANPNDHFAYQQALFDVALDQAGSDGKGALDGVLDLQAYTRQRLREQMLADYPHEANYFADELILELEVAVGVPGGAGAGSGGGEPLVSAGEKTLSEFAIGNLSSLGGARIARIRHRDGQLIMPWMTAEYLTALVQNVDIGGHYPRYVAQALNDPATRPERVRRFAREWRQALLFSALPAKLDGGIDAAGLQCIVDLCKGHIDRQLPNIALIPLAFKRQAHADSYDLVRGMYVIFSAQPGVVLLYRPLYGQAPLQQFASIGAMMAAIRASATLQASLLDWIAPQVRHIYAEGGFSEPHVSSIGLDPYDLPERPAPVGLAATLWLADVDEKLYRANHDLLVELAHLHTVSSTQSRWAVLAQGAWLLFDVVTALLRGPVANVLWLVQLVSSLEHDLTQIERGSDFERSAAAVDLIVNAAMSLLHLRLPRVAGLAEQPPADARAFDGPPAQGGDYRALEVAPVQGRVSDSTVPAWQLDHTWRGNQGFNWLPAEQRKALMAMRSRTLLEGLQPSPEGLYEVAGRHYVSMLGERFEVRVQAEGIRVVDDAGELGPWLLFESGAWRIDTGLRLAAGAPRVRLDRQFARMRSAVDGLTTQAATGSLAFNQLGVQVVRSQQQLEVLEGLRSAEQHRRQQADARGDDAFNRVNSDRTVALYDERMAALDTDMKALRLRAVGEVEAVVRLDSEQDALVQRMLEPKYGAYRQGRFGELLAQHKADIKIGLIRNNDFVLNELWNLADYPQLTELAQGLGGQSLVHARGAYQRFRARLAAVVELQERMLVAQGNLDSLLSEASPDLVIPTGTDSRTVSELVAARRFSTVDLRFHHVLNLADLSLHLDSASGQRRLAAFKASLAGSTLRSAANAHGESIVASLPAADRISILQDAWDEYAAAIINSLYIERKGTALIDDAMLKRYRVHVQLLKDDAGRRLLEATAEQEGAPRAQAQASHSPYPISTEPQQVIRNSEGQIIIATQVQRDGRTVLEVRDPISHELVQTFEAHDGQWLEQAADDGVTDPLTADAGQDVTGQVQALLEENQEVLAMARDYVARDVSGPTLRRLLKRQIEKLQTAASALASQGASTQALPLQAEVEALQASRTRLLTELYSKTHYPTAEALRFLHDQQLLRVEYVRRDISVMSSPFDEFKVIRLNAAGASKGQAVWAAHFHLASQSALLEDFTRAHLKVWTQRFLGRQYEVASGERVHRGPLTRAQVAGIIPLTATA